MKRAVLVALLATLVIAGIWFVNNYLLLTSAQGTYWVA